MGNDLATPIEIVARVLANEFLVTAISIAERNITTGQLLPTPSIEISWVKRSDWVVRQSGVTTVDGVTLRQVAGTLQRLAYKALQDAGVFPPGFVT